MLRLSMLNPLRVNWNLNHVMHGSHWMLCLNWNHLSLAAILIQMSWMYIMSKLSYMGTSSSLRVQSYRSLIESTLLYNCTVIYNHMTDKDKAELNKVTNLASHLSELPNPWGVIHQRITTKALRLVASDTDPVMSLDTLPSGRYRIQKSRVNLRSNCFRSVVTCVLNDKLF